jgi:AcrR family transcriptional regulator
MTKPSLRERKKAQTRAALRMNALRLFREQGYTETTVEQIAAAAEVLLEAFHRQPPELSPIAAIRAATKDAFASFGAEDMEVLGASAELMLHVPELRARALDEYARTIEVMGDAIARRTGLSATDSNVQVLAGAVIGVIMAVTMPWDNLAGQQADVRELFARIDEGLSLLESGLPF